MFPFFGSSEHPSGTTYIYLKLFCVNFLNLNYIKENIGHDYELRSNDETCAYRGEE